MKLYYAPTMNPRKACATAKLLGSPVEHVRLDLAKGEHKLPEHVAHNPNGRVPFLVHGDTTVWESAAIMMYLAQQAGSDLWPASDPARQVDVMRWLTWDAFHFAPHAGAFYFEHHIKPTLLGKAPDPSALTRATQAFHASAKVLDAHLATRTHLVGERLSIADFAVGVLLPDAEAIMLPLEAYPNVRRWNARLLEIPAWRDPWPA